MNNFGRQALVLGQPTNYLTGVGWSFLQVINESPYMLSLNFSGIGSVDFPAWHREDMSVGRGYTGQLSITPSDITGAGSTAPSNLVSVNGFLDGELGQPMSVALARLVHTVSNPATSVSNLNNPSGTPLVTSLVSGDTQTAVSLTNDGILVLGNSNHHGSISSDNGAVATDGNGNLTVSSTIKPFNINSDQTKFQTDGSGNLNCVDVTLNQMIFKLAGSLTGISAFGPYTVGTTGTAFAHNLGGTPTIVLCVIQGTAGGAGALHNVKVDSASYTSTQFTAIADAANVSFVGIAIKF